MIKAIIFDFAGVIGTEGYSLWAKEQKIKGIESNSTFFGDISDNMDRGDISTQTFSQEVAKVVGIARNDVWKEIDEILKDTDSIPDKIRDAVINNGGGHVNHSFFWEILSPEGGGEPEGHLNNAIEKKFKSFEKFKEEFSNVAVSRFGSGWAWLTKDNSGKLVIMSTPNQDSPVSQGLVPLFGVDVWEHAYYLKYQNRRAEYIENWWNVVNWEEVGRRFMV